MTDNRVGLCCLAILNAVKASHFYHAFTPMHFLIYYLTFIAKETQRTGVITFVLYEQGNQGMEGFNLLSRDIQSTTEQDLS